MSEQWSLLEPEEIGPMIEAAGLLPTLALHLVSQGAPLCRDLWETVQEAIAAVAEGRGEQGFTSKGGAFCPWSEVVKKLHLEPFVEAYRGGAR